MPDSCAETKAYELTVCRRVESPVSSAPCIIDDLGNVISGSCGDPPPFINPSECMSAREMAEQACNQPRTRPPVETEYSSRSVSEVLDTSLELPENPGVIPIARPQQGQSESIQQQQQAGAPSETGYTSQDLLTDINSCNTDSQQAYKCCNNPEKCGASSSSSSYSAPPPSDSEGMKRYCERMKYAGLSNERANDKAAGVCHSNHTACSANCKRSKEKWEAYLPNCRAPGCDPQRVNEALAIFNRKVSECRGLEQNEQVLARQSDSSYSAARQAYQCEQQAKQDPSSMANGQNDQASTASLGPDCSGENATKPECVDCSKYPNSPLCSGGANVGGQDSLAGKLTQAAGTGVSFNDFNTNTGGEGLPQFPQFESIQPQQAQGHAIQNGGGAMLGGGEGGGGMASSEGGAASSGGGYNTDVLSDGTTGGSGYSAAATATGGSAGGGFGGYGGKAGEDGFKSRYNALDLKQYLPGGKKDPARNVASKDGPATGHPEIAPMGKSMFRIISDRFAKMCRDKQLIGCE